MEETRVFRVRTGPFCRRFLIILPALLLAFAAMMPINGLGYLPFLFIALVLLVLPMLLLLLPTNYQVESGVVYASYRFDRRRRIHLPSKGIPLVYLTSFGGSPSLCVNDRSSTFQFHEVDDQREFVEAVSSLLPVTAVREVSSEASYRGIATFHLLAGIVLLVLTVPMLLFLLTVGVMSGSPVVWMFLPFTVVFVLIGLLYLLLGTNVRVRRSKTTLSSIDLLRQTRQVLDVSDAQEVRHDSILNRGRIVTKGGAFVLPSSFGTDRRLLYDVFALASGNFVYADQAPGS